MCARKQDPGFTLMELLLGMFIVAILSTLGFSAYKSIIGQATRAHCSSNLRQLSAAVNLYTSDNSGFFPPYCKRGDNGQRMWYFGLETTKAGTAEGKRNLDVEQGPLYPYIQAVGSIEICKGFNYDKAIWKAKFKGASYGYGYNWWLGGRSSGRILMNVASIRGGANILLFGDCGQVNTFQSPASADNPLIEEFYIIDEQETTVHFRHSRRANIVFVDGHVEVFKPYPGTENDKVEGELLGRITKKGSTEYIK